MVQVVQVQGVQAVHPLPPQTVRGPPGPGQVLVRVGSGPGVGAEPALLAGLTVCLNMN